MAVSGTQPHTHQTINTYDGNPHVSLAALARGSGIMKHSNYKCMSSFHSLQEYASCNCNTQCHRKTRRREQATLYVTDSNNRRREQRGNSLTIKSQRSHVHKRGSPADLWQTCAQHLVGKGDSNSTCDLQSRRDSMGKIQCGPRRKCRTSN